MDTRSTLHALLCTVLAAGVSACGDDPVGFEDRSDPPSICDLPEKLTATAGFPDGIPALTEPALVAADAASHMEDSDRVLGVVVDGEARAYPHTILWSHEVVNDRFGDRWVTVSFCPLTGSGLAMDATIGGSRIEFGVSGLLFANNLVFFDRASEGLFGPQLSVDATCEAFAGASPTLIPVREMSWARWRSLYPQTRVLSDQTGYDRNYRQYPYGEYDEVGNDDLLFPMETDTSRPMKERVLGIRNGVEGGRSYPFGELSESGDRGASLGDRGASSGDRGASLGDRGASLGDRGASLGDRGAVNDRVGTLDVVIFYEAAGGEAAAAYSPIVDGLILTFEADEFGFRDVETGTRWDFGGRATEGPLAPARLEPLAEAYVVFWFAWRHFQPAAGVWTAG